MRRRRSSDLTVTADDGARSFEARVFPDGRFSLHISRGAIRRHGITRRSGWNRAKRGRASWRRARVDDPAPIGRGHPRSRPRSRWRRDQRPSVVGRARQLAADGRHGGRRLRPRSPGSRAQLRSLLRGREPAHDHTAFRDGTGRRCGRRDRGAPGPARRTLDSPSERIVRSIGSRFAPSTRLLPRTTTTIQTTATSTAPAGSSCPFLMERRRCCWWRPAADGTWRSRCRSRRSAIPSRSASIPLAARTRSGGGRIGSAEGICRRLRRNSRRRVRRSVSGYLSTIAAVAGCSVTDAADP